MEIVAQRVFSPVYIWLDIVFLAVFCALLILKKKYLTCIFALFGGVLYMIVDYGIFNLALHTRTIENGNMFWVLLWMSLSYGITNFAWIWLWISKDKHLIEWSLLICVWWVAAPMIASTFTPADMPLITIQRTTGSYHGVMGLILFVGYLACIVYNLLQREKLKRFPLMWMLAIGILVQFAWEFSLLIGGIRSAAITDWGQKLTTLIVNSLVETNLGMPIIFPLYVLITSHYTEDCKKRVGTVSFTDRVEEINSLKVNRTLN
jgi:hypothetical protein